MINLKAKRIEKGLTQQQLADEIHCVRTVIANIECGTAQPSIETAKAIGKVLEFDWWMFFEEGGETDGHALHGTGSRQTLKN